MATDAQGRQLSDDGNYYWDGTNWQLVDQSAASGGDGSAASGGDGSASAQQVIDQYTDAQGNTLFLYDDHCTYYLQWAESQSGEHILGTETYNSAQECYVAIAPYTIPMPSDVEQVFDTLNELAPKLADISATALQTSAEVDLWAGFVQKVADALILFGALPFIGAGAAAIGAALHAATVETEDVAQKVMQIANGGFETAADLVSWALWVQQNRTVSDQCRQAVSAANDALSTVGNAVLEAIKP